MTDTGEDITVPDTMTVAQLIALESDTDGRFGFKIDPSGLFATCIWVNFYKKDDKREKDVKKGCWKLLERQTKKVVIQ